MADAPVPSFSRAREEKISELSNFFANDDLTIDELERRIERVYKASNLSELDTITADLRSAVARPDAAPHPPHTSPSRPPTSISSLPSSASSLGGSAHRDHRTVAVADPSAPPMRIRSIMSSTRRVGRWSVPSQVEVLGVMSDAGVDLTHAALPRGIVDIHLRVVMSSFKLVVPANVRVINEAHSFMASVRCRADEISSYDADEASGATIIRLTGYAVMADVDVVVRHGDSATSDDWDD